MSKQDAASIGNIYGKMLDSFKYKNNLTEAKNNNAFGDQPELIGDGPNTDGFHEALNDEKDCSCNKKSKKKKPCGCNHKNNTANGEENLKENKKNKDSTLNNFMSKSVFDKLYNKVLRENFGAEDAEDEALGLADATPDSDLGDEDFGDESGDDFGDDETSVTVTLDKDTAKALFDVLKAVVGEEDMGEMEDMGDEGDDLDFGDEDEMDYDEAEEDEEVGTKPMADKKKAFQGKSNVVAGPPKPKSTHANADVTDDCDTTHSAPPIAALQGKNNQVPGSKLKKASDFFQ